MLIGYARVSTADQDVSLQVDALENAGCEKIFKEMASGSKKLRPRLQEAFDFVRPGDTLVVWKLDRLGRSLKNLIQFVEQLKGKGVSFRSLTDGIDTSTPAGKFFFHMMGALAEMERDLIRERTMAGLAAARKRGKIGGRKSKVDSIKARLIENLLELDVPKTEIARQAGISRSALYRHLAKQKKANLE